ncbi:MAG: hypothetical protein ACHP8A_16835 [Terriglobales bacterium]
MEISGAMLTREDVGGVFPLLAMVSAYAAIERGSDLMEPRDLIKAIYIADLEHVSSFWDNWEGFEKLVTSERLVTGGSMTYINRCLYLMQIHLMSKEHQNGFTGLAKVSPAYQEIVADARKLATERTGLPSTPSARDLLFCVCNKDPELSVALQASGLKLKKLDAAVRKSGP